MIVDTINSDLHGGAATAALRLHESLLAVGVESHFWHSPRAKHTVDAANVLPLAWPRPWLKLFLGKLRLKCEKWRYLSGRSSNFEIFTHFRQPTATPFDPNRLQGDVLHLHWVSRWLDGPSFFASIPNQRPIVWTLHDMNPMTGGCHYAYDCEAYRHECDSCPQLVNSGPKDLANRSFHAKRQSLAGSNLHIVTPSHWLERHVRQSQVLSAAQSIQTIRNGLDLQLFAPADKQQARRSLSLPDSKTVVGFGAVSLTNRRKGFQDFQQAMVALKDKSQIIGLCFGDQRQIIFDDGMPEMRTIGYLTDARQQALAYSAMDLFVLPSWADNMPQTAVEAMACGTPVIAYDVGGIPEIVKPMQTGLLVPWRDTIELSNQIQWLVDRPDERRQLSARARRLIEQEFALQKCAGEYLELYRSVREGRSQLAA